MTQTVVLVPGFLGFDHFGNFTYFADRFVAGLSMALKLLGGVERYRVVAVPSIPIGSLAARQQKLIESLHRIADRLKREGHTISRWHLVGHSTGGLDASFLTRTQALSHPGGRRRPSEFDPSASPDPPQPIASVTTIAAPFYGSTLALCDVAQVTEFGVRKVSPRALQQAASGLLNAVSGSRQSRIPFALGVLSGRNQVNFLYDLLLADGLAVDLRPDAASKLTETDNQTDVPHFSIATIAPAPASDAERRDTARAHGIQGSESVADGQVAVFAPTSGPAEQREVDPLFRQIYELTAEAARRAKRAPEFPEQHTYPIIASKGHRTVFITPEANDGVVNTDRQVLGGKLAGLVVGDHADVLGQYRREDLTTPDQNIDDGLLTSGANFGDAEFFDLINLVAHGILKA